MWQQSHRLSPASPSENARRARRRQQVLLWHADLRHTPRSERRRDGGRVPARRECSRWIPRQRQRQQRTWPATSILGLRSRPPHLYRNWAHAWPHLHWDGACPSQILHRDWAHPSNSLARPCHICIGAWLNPACGRYHNRPSLPSASLRAQADNAGVAYTIRRQRAVILVTRDRPELERLLLQAPYALSPASAAPAIGRVR
jgi:hypothetical protein